MKEYLRQYEKWLSSDRLSKEEKEELESIKNDEEEIESRFYGALEFGTAGLRGIMAAGLNRMNVHVIRHTTQAFANIISQYGEEGKARGVAISYDCRNNSREFAKETARVMAANGIRVRLFEDMRPTPELSFAVIKYNCIAGVNITASHNPKEYNGYKVYWEDGAQLPPEHAEKISREMKKLDIFDDINEIDYETALARGLITIMGRQTDEFFLEKVMEQVNDYDVVKRCQDEFKMVYTPFHGTGYRLIPEALSRLGIKNLICVPEQMVIDGNFPTVKSPNPENPEGFRLAVRLAEETGADFILGSDPDADRVGIMVRAKNGEFIPISGNQTGALLLDYLIGAKTRKGTMPPRPAALKTIVTTDMAAKIAEDNGLDCYDTFTGFKFIAEKKNELETAGRNKVIFSYEESYGYMAGDFVADKDAVTASVLLAEMAAWYYSKGMTLYDALQELYKKYGYYSEKTISIVMPGIDGIEKMAAIMKELRDNSPADIAGERILEIKDYRDGIATDTATGKKEKMELEGSNVLRYEMEDDTSIIIRPSGTEPKIKIYVLTKGHSKEDCQEKIARYQDWTQELSKR